jgi:PAS domain S-box-containing protein
MRKTPITIAKIAAFSGGAASVLGALGLSGWITGLRTLASLRPEYVPMAPDTGLLFVALGAILFSGICNKSRGLGRSLAIVVASLASFYGALKTIETLLGIDLTFQRILFPDIERLGAIVLGRMSPVTGILFFLSGIALLVCLFCRARRWPREAASGLGAIVSFSGSVAVTGYLFGSPLLYGGATIPLAATTAAAFLFLGLGLTAAAGKKTFLMRELSGPSASARLLRGILPVIVLAIVIDGVLGTRLADVFGVNRALLSAVLTLASMAVAVVMVVRIARSVFRRAEEAEAERRRAEEALRQSEERYRNLFENNHAVMLIIDPVSGAIVDANPAAAAYYGWTRDELRRMNIDRINTLPPSELSVEMNRARLEQRRHFFFRHRRADGSVRSVEVFSGPIMLEDRPLLYSIVHDVTEREKAEKALRRSEERFRQIADTEGDFIWEVDAEGLYTYVNPVVEKILGYRPEELVGKLHFYDLFAPDVREELKAGAMGTFAGKTSFREFVNPNIRKDGACVILETNGSPIIGESGEFLGYRGTDKDITERKRAEEALRDSVKQKGLLMKELEHRVKNSLAMVSGLLGLGMDTLTDARAKGIFAETRSRIRSVASLYEQLYGTDDPVSVDLGRYIQRLAEALFKTYAAGSGNIAWKTRLDEVRLDTKRTVPLGLILNELVTNSLKYAYPGGSKGEIRIDLERSGDLIILGVSDDGPGLPEGFDPETSGGMGWSLVRMLTEEIGGELTCPAVGKGVRVLIRFTL